MAFINLRYEIPNILGQEEENRKQEKLRARFSTSGEFGSMPNHCWSDIETRPTPDDPKENPQYRAVLYSMSSMLETRCWGHGDWQETEATAALDAAFLLGAVAGTEFLKSLPTRGTTRCRCRFCGADHNIPTEDLYRDDFKECTVCGRNQDDPAVSVGL